MATMIRSPDPDALDAAAALLRRGELVAFPTETVYGLGANAWDPQAVAKIFAAKGRPATNPLIVHVASSAQLPLAMSEQTSADVRGWLLALGEFWPGPLTAVVPRNGRIPDVVTAGLDTVGVRVPDHPVALDLLRRCEFPVAAPSANPSNYVSPTCAEHVERELGSRVALILDGGACRAGVESTIVTLAERRPRVLRVGALAVEDLARCLRLSVDELLSGDASHRSSAPSPQLSPGRLPEHYAPRTPLIFTPEAERIELPSRYGRIAFHADSPLLDAAAAVVQLSERMTFADIARGLFAALRELDARRLDLIVVDVCPEEGLGRAIMDRLRRAAYGARARAADEAPAADSPAAAATTSAPPARGPSDKL